MKALTHLTSVSVAIFGAISSSPAALVGFWDFEENTGTTTADQSGGGHTGTLDTGATWSTDVAPVPSGSTASIRFDGTATARVQTIGYKAPEVGGTNSRTLAAWIKTTTSPTSVDMGIFGYGENATTQKWVFRTQDDNGTAGAIRAEVNGGYIVGSTPVTDGDWHHVAMTWENDGTANVQDTLLYVDGVLDGISTSLTRGVNTDTSAGIDLLLGSTVNGRVWNGWLDDMRIYNEVLDSNAIAELAGVPEPSSTFALGFVGLALILRRRRS